MGLYYKQRLNHQLATGINYSFYLHITRNDMFHLRKCFCTKLKTKLLMSGGVIMTLFLLF